MEEGSKVRLVRCPKCENLLPELPDFSVYQCGGCGAVLRAKKKGPLSDGLLEKFDEERSRGFSEKGVGVSSLESVSESESDGFERGCEKERDCKEGKVNLVGTCSTITENMELVNDSSQTTGRDAMNSIIDQSNEDGKGGYGDDRYTNCSKRPIKNLIHRNCHKVIEERTRHEFGSSYVENGVKGLKAPTEDFAGSLRSRPVVDQWGTGREGSSAFQGRGAGIAERRRFSTYPYPDEGPSNYQRDSFYSFPEQKRIHSDLDAPSRVENLEHDRAELLRKLDELKDQLSRSCDATEKPKSGVPLATKVIPRPPPHPPLPPPVLSSAYSRHASYAPEGPTSLYTVNTQPSALNKRIPEPPCFNHNYGNCCGLDMHNFYPPPRNFQDEFSGYEGSYIQQSRKSPYQPPSEYTRHYDDHFLGQHMDFYRSAFTSHRHETFSHQAACSCSQCYNKNCQIPPNDPFERYVTYDPRHCDSRVADPHLHSLPRQPQTRGSVNFDLGVCGFPRRNPRQVVFTHGTQRACHPIASGAPFLTCNSCFHVLKLPRKVSVMGKNQHEVRCGTCSAIISINLEKKGLVVPVPAVVKQVSAEGGDGYGEALNEKLKSSCSDDYDRAGYNFQLTETEPYVMSIDQRVHFGEPNGSQGSLSSSSSLSEDDQSPDSVIVQKDNAKDDALLPFPDSFHHKDPDNASADNVVNRYGTANRSKHDGPEKIIEKSALRQISVKDASVATEMEVAFDEVPNSGMSRDSAEKSKEEDRPRINRGSESFLASMIKKSFRDLSRSSQSSETGKANVFVNGQLISDRVVKKAEKLAGPIQPGNYWYDYQAGFWGVMDQSCLGIIPPFIEEFNIPLPEHCAAGNTNVFVNGRELHQKDLDLLAARGLPTTRDKHYIVEISGRVYDEYTGEELDSLGKLAPTVERVKHGFGMKVPKTLAQ